MPHWQSFLCGAVGGGLIFLVSLYRHLQTRRQWPWRVKNGPTFGIYVTGELIRIVLGAIVAWGLAASGPLGTLGALMAGAGAPAILEQWQRMGPHVAAAGQQEGGGTPVRTPRQATRASRGRKPAPESPESLSTSTVSEGGA
ncbi:hypothetical protein ACF9IK_25250 [Kitasatospora hibisci]|uniref:hypothetical protein n=1 Tax=Kitasatospora hibisci TaxID=3369522 RepID=UPI0037553E99